MDAEVSLTRHSQSLRKIPCHPPTEAKWRDLLFTLPVAQPNPILNLERQNKSHRDGGFCIPQSRSWTDIVHPAREPGCGAPRNQKLIDSSACRGRRIPLHDLADLLAIIGHHKVHHQRRFLA